MRMSLENLKKLAVTTQKSVTYFRVSGNGALYRHVIFPDKIRTESTKIFAGHGALPLGNLGSVVRFTNFWEAHAYRMRTYADIS